MRRSYAGMITAMDEQIGRIVKALEKKGMRDNTLILFSCGGRSTRTRVKICAGIREYLIANGIEPELDALVRRREEAAVELANIPDTREVRASDEAILSRGHSEEHRADALRKIEKMLDQTAERMEAGQRLEVIDTASTRA